MGRLALYKPGCYLRHEARAFVLVQVADEYVQPYVCACTYVRTSCKYERVTSRTTYYQWYEYDHYSCTRPRICASSAELRRSCKRRNPHKLTHRHRARIARSGSRASPGDPRRQSTCHCALSRSFILLPRPPSAVSGCTSPPTALLHLLRRRLHSLGRWRAWRRTGRLALPRPSICARIHPSARDCARSISPSLSVSAPALP